MEIINPFLYKILKHLYIFPHFSQRLIKILKAKDIREVSPPSLKILMEIFSIHAVRIVK